MVDNLLGWPLGGFLTLKGARPVWEPRWLEPLPLGKKILVHGLRQQDDHPVIVAVDAEVSLVRARRDQQLVDDLKEPPTAGRPRAVLAGLIHDVLALIDE